MSNEKGAELRLGQLIQPDAPLYKLDSIHEVLNLVIGFFWLLGYGALLQKLRKDKSASGLSLQTLLALCFTELANLITVIFAYKEFSIEPRTFRLLLNCATCFISLFTYITVIRKYKSTYEYELDSFGVHPLNICCLKRRKIFRKREIFCLGIKFHWMALYIYSLIFGALLQRYRRHALPSWFGFWECSIDALMALALLPQLHMFWNNRSRRVNGLLGRFVICLLLAKIASLIYWSSDVFFHGTYVPGRGIHIFTELLNIIILLDFAYYYVKSKRLGHVDVTLPV